MPESLHIPRAGKEKTGLLSIRLNYYSWIILSVWTGCIVASLLWNLKEHRENTLKIARNSAQITFENDVLYRKWAATQGGVYVITSEQTPPNPYLDVPNRDVTTTSGLHLTLVNPAYMARQVNQMAAGIHAGRGHITSLNPIRAENQPDPWEAAALKSFEKGVKEVASLEKMEGKEYMRLMRPFIAEKSCLKCHGAQGYKEGDIRGGISVSVPMEPLLTIERPHFMRMSLAHLFLWMMGIVGIVMSRKSLVKQVIAREGAEAALVERTVQLEAANKELESFSYSVSHDLRAPLRAIDGYSRMLVKKYGDRIEDDTVRLLAVIRSNTHNMECLIDDILAFSRVLTNSISISAIDMEKLVSEVWDDIRAAHQGRALEFKITKLLPGFGDRSLIKQVLFNLISNAVKFTKNREPGIIQITSYTEPGKVVYCVKDNGVGFDMRFYDKLFGVFQRLHSNEEYEGTGVGLTIVQRIINRHGGRVWAEGEVDKGATFYFTLPTQQ
jgi:signal transduction histidine kinase